MIYKNILLFLTISVVLLSCDIDNPKRLTYYVSPNGSEDNTGTENNPFNSVEKARDAIRLHVKENGYPEDGIVVYLREGDYLLDESLQFGPEDSGIDGSPIIYTSFPGERARLLGGIILNPSNTKTPKNLTNLTDSTTKNRIVAISLEEYSDKNFGEIRQHGFSIAILPAQAELFLNHKPMTLARYPNDGLLKIEKVFESGAKPKYGDFSGKKPVIGYTGDRQERWNENNDIWISGYFNRGYADDNLPIQNIDLDRKKITIGKPHMYGLAESDPNDHWGGTIRGFYYFNVQEELDAPGEYYINTIDRELLFISPDSTKENENEIALSMLEDPMLAVIGSSYLTFKDITLEYGRGMAIYLEGGEGNGFEGLKVRNFGTVGVMMGKGISGNDSPIHEFTGNLKSKTIGNLKAHYYLNTAFNNNAGTNHSISNSEFYNLGSGAIILSGGDRASLSRGNNKVENCSIFDFNRRNKSYCAGITIYGVGNSVRKNQIYNGPHQGIALFGNEHLIEYNHFTKLVTHVIDNGVIYIGRNPSERGNIIRYNLLSNNGKDGFKNCGIHLDDHASGVSIYGNIFFRSSHLDFADILLNGGSHNVIDNNIFYEGTYALWLQDPFVSGNNLFKNNTAYKEGNVIYNRLFKDIDIKKAVWKKAYPELLNAIDSNKFALLDNEFTNNLIVNSELVVSETATPVTVFKRFENNELVNDESELDKLLRGKHDLENPMSTIKVLAESKKIPFDSINVLNPWSKVNN